MVGPVKKYLSFNEFLFRQETPEVWQKSWNGPENPSDYIKCIVGKVNEIQKWTSRIDQGSLLKDSIDFADLFHPDTFLSSLAQQSAREFNTSMSDMKLETSWSRGGVTGSKITIKVRKNIYASFIKYFCIWLGK